MTLNTTQSETDSSNENAETDGQGHEERLEAVEAKVERQQTVLGGLKARLHGEDGEGIGPVVTRRGILTAGSLLGLLGLGVGSTSADASGQIGTSNDPLQDLYTANLHGDSGTVSVNDTLDLNGNNVETSSGGMTITTNGNGNIILNPGSGNELSLSNQSTSSSGSLLAIDSGNVVEASGTTLTDVGGGSAAWGDGDADTLLEPSDGTKAGIEGINEIRTNNSLTVNIDATDDSTSETFTVQQDTDGTATSLLTVNEGGDVDVNTGSLDLNGNNIRNVGGSESAGSGAIRLANGATVTAESSGGNAIELLKTDASDNVTLGRGDPDNATTVTVQGPHSDDNLKFGGSPGAKLNASGDLELDFDADNSGDSNDSLNVVGSDGSSDVTYFQVKNDGTVTVNNGNLDAQGGTVENTNGDLTLKTNGTQALKLLVGNSSIAASSDSSTPPNVIGGHPSNNTGGTSVKGVTIAGGGGDTDWDDNTASANWATVGGGVGNRAKAKHSTVSGGHSNEASGMQSVVSGGNGNKASNQYSTVGGGDSNQATTARSTVPGGYNNKAAGDGSFAAGNRAEAADDNTFVWSDGSTPTDISQDSIGGLSSSNTVTSASEPTGSQTFSVSANGGVRFVTGSSTVAYLSSGSGSWASASSRAFKTNIDPVDTEQILDGVTEMEVATWEYEDDNGEGQGVTHIGPMAEDFHDVVDIGSSDEHINSLNADGMAFAAIQGLSQKHEEKDERIDDLEAENEQLRERNAELEDRLAAVEAELGIDASAGQQGVADD
jgi:hypothetical protein